MPKAALQIPALSGMQVPTIRRNPFMESSMPMATRSLLQEASPLFGGFHEVVDNVYNPAQGAIANPVAMLEQYHNNSKVWRFVGNVDIDYRLHPLPELRFHVTGGLDLSHGKRTVWMPQNSFDNYTSGGYSYTQGPQKNTNRLLTAYANYNKTFDAIQIVGRRNRRLRLSVLA